MNKRIKELAEQSTTYIEPTSNSGEGWIFDKEKFAELIIKECSGLINSMDHSSQYFPHVADAIKEHFGVKE
jgi:hypothetical protein